MFTLAPGSSACRSREVTKVTEAIPNPIPVEIFVDAGSVIFNISMCCEIVFQFSLKSGIQTENMILFSGDFDFCTFLEWTWLSHSDLTRFYPCYTVNPVNPASLAPRTLAYQPLSDHFKKQGNRLLCLFVIVDFCY